MNDGCVEIFCGNGRGKTSMALGKSIRSCSRGNSVVIIQFLKGRETGELNYLNNMNLDIKLRNPISFMRNWMSRNRRSREKIDAMD